MATLALEMEPMKPGEIRQALLDPMLEAVLKAKDGGGYIFNIKVTSSTGETKILNAMGSLFRVYRISRA